MSSITKTAPHDRAYPFKPDGWPQELGLSKREYFAGLMMQGLLANLPGIKDLYSDYTVADVAVHFADKLINKLNEGEEPNE